MFSCGQIAPRIRLPGMPREQLCRLVALNRNIFVSASWRSCSQTFLLQLYHLSKANSIAEQTVVKRRQHFLSTLSTPELQAHSSEPSSFQSQSEKTCVFQLITILKSTSIDRYTCIDRDLSIYRITLISMCWPRVDGL